MKRTMFTRMSSWLVAMSIFSTLVGCATNGERQNRVVTGEKSTVEQVEKRMAVYEKFVPPLESNVDAQP